MADRVTQVEAAVEEELVDFVATYGLRPAKRGSTTDGSTWSIDGEVLVECRHDGGSVRVVVHDIGLVQTLRRRLRRRAAVEHVLDGERGE